MTAERLTYLRQESNAERLDFIEIAEIEEAFSKIPDRHLQDERENATVPDMLGEIEAQQSHKQLLKDNRQIAIRLAKVLAVLFNASGSFSYHISYMKRGWSWQRRGRELAAVGRAPCHLTDGDMYDCHVVEVYGLKNTTGGIDIIWIHSKDEIAIGAVEDGKQIDCTSEDDAILKLVKHMVDCSIVATKKIQNGSLAAAVV